MNTGGGNRPNSDSEGNKVSTRDPGRALWYVKSIQKSSSGGRFGLELTVHAPDHDNMVFFLTHRYPAVATTNERTTPPTPPPRGMSSQPGWVVSVPVRGERRPLELSEIGGRREHTRARATRGGRGRTTRERAERRATPSREAPRSKRCTVLRSTKTCRGQQTRRREHRSMIRGEVFGRMGRDSSSLMISARISRLMHTQERAAHAQTPCLRMHLAPLHLV